MSRMRHVCFLCGALILAVCTARAQSSPTSNQTTGASAGESSSTQYQLAADDDPGGAGELRAAAASLGSGSAAGQDGGHYHGFNRFAFEAGGGFNAPIGNDTSTGGGGPFITWGGNFTAGGGLNFSRRFALLGEFQFIDDKLPASLINEAGDGAEGGNTHIISLTADPYIDLFPRWRNSIYVTGGGGYYHKSTNFNAQECCDFYGYPVTVTLGSFSSNQAGVNAGIGYIHRLGGTADDSHMKLFAEARYVYIHTPPIIATNGLGTTELIPVTFGVRW
jgi:hypothetical protein